MGIIAGDKYPPTESGPITGRSKWIVIAARGKAIDSIWQTIEGEDKKQVLRFAQDDKLFVERAES